MSINDRRDFLKKQTLQCCAKNNRAVRYLAFFFERHFKEPDKDRYTYNVGENAL